MRLIDRAEASPRADRTAGAAAAPRRSGTAPAPGRTAGRHRRRLPARRRTARVPPQVGIVVRDRKARPAPGRYNVCYVNGFQTQPDERRFWTKKSVPRSCSARTAAGWWTAPGASGCSTSARRASASGSWRSCGRGSGAARSWVRRRRVRQPRLVHPQPPAARSAPSDRLRAAAGARRAQRGALRPGRRTWPGSTGGRWATTSRWPRSAAATASVRRTSPTTAGGCWSIEYRRADFAWTCDRYGDRLAVVLRDRALSPSRRAGVVLRLSRGGRTARPRCASRPGAATRPRAGVRARPRAAARRAARGRGRGWSGSRCRAAPCRRGRPAAAAGRRGTAPRASKNVGEHHRGVEPHVLVGLGEGEELGVLRGTHVRDHRGQPRVAGSSRSRYAGPVNSLPTGPEPTWMTTGVPASSIGPNASSSSGSSRANSPTWVCSLKTSTPSSIRSAT